MGVSLDVLACVASSGLRDGSDLGLIPDIVRRDGCQGLKIIDRDLLRRG